MRERFKSMLDRWRIPEGTDTPYWFTRYAKSLIFLILVLVAAGIYLAFTIPISVFPTTDFPRVLIGVDNGVMPIDQMMVTVTRPIEESVNAVPGLQQVQIDHQPRLGGDRPVLQLGRQHGDHAAARRCGAGQRPQHSAADRDDSDTSSDVRQFSHHWI